jgi:hypothetical protein
MPTDNQKERTIKRINVTVLTTAKNVLTDFQEKGGYASQGDALNDLLLDYGRLLERVKELESQQAEAKKE